MEIQSSAVVGLTYELKVSKIEDDIESVPFSVEVRDEEDPFYFLFGQSGLPERFEELLKGKKEGDDFAFSLSVEEAYGEPDDDLLVNLPKSQFSQDRGFSEEMIKEGEFLPLMDENGYPMQAKILKDLGETILLDFNHPLVGFDLHFEGSIIEVREATPDEIAHGHVHGEGGEEE
ncbi:FKBP-type peptidyl-prolyl cis-trans isomerase SlyD [Algoriphagus faecimaris]|uniref:peptidylprolyl isomerase n=1 Tax=Algoriphagus faecimaris TaxID=686796 RepID=A0A1G6TCF5_9BACT|nr:peptidylprolyl isomerase [Algoriphagus faecimaris]SDD26236.1 FKBP-type peptidyl-prolyl cis-trans isomerase SlyD [Algoriphagus faecimaris]